MGAVYNPFIINGDANSPTFSVQDVAPPNGVDFARLDRRRMMRQALDDWQRDKETSSKASQTMDEFYHRAFSLVTSPDAKKAFNLKEEPAKLRDEYGRNTFGQSCLLARRMVEAGVRCISINNGGWDTHTDNFNALKNGLLPPLDMGYSALINDLKQRGMLDTTLVICMGEFGRTPRINYAKDRPGRDHWPSAMSVVVSGGGLKMGQVIGSTNAKGEHPKDQPLTVNDLWATMFSHLGIDCEQTSFLDHRGRPMSILPEGKPIAGLV